MLRKVKNILKGTLIEDIYKKTRIYKKRKKEYMHQLKKKVDILKNKYKKLIVQNGPFKGMPYIENSYGSDFISKIEGDYEREISGWFDSIKKEFELIVDIGCAEGYYAIGLARKFPKTKVIAYDISFEARKLCEELKKINKIKNVEIKNYCSFKEINSFPKNTLIICDIEGGEKNILNPKKANFRNKTIIVEAHECFEKDIVKNILNRFKDTHNFEIRYNNILKRNSFGEKEREGYTPWIKLTPK